jgi:hypothetical protein
MLRVMSRFLIIFSVLVVLLVGTAATGCGKNTGNQTTNQAVQDPQEKGDPDWWKKQPDLKKEDQAVQSVISDFGKALAAKDVKQAASYFAPEAREKYSQVLAISPDLLPQMAKDLEKATLSFLSLDTDFSLSRMAEYQLKVDGNTFYIVFIKIDGKWMLESY